jgi:hypothetical protein
MNFFKIPKKKIIYPLIIGLLSYFFLLTAVLVQAASPSPTASPSPASSPSSSPSAGNVSGTKDVKLQLQVPLLGYTEASNIAEYIGKVYTAALYIIVPFIIVVIIFSGLLWIFSGGDKEIIGKAKSRIIHGFIGLGIALFSYVLLSFVGINTISTPDIEYINPVVLEFQNNLATSWNTSGSPGVGGKNVKEICKKIMAKPELIEAYKKASAATGVSWTVFGGIHFRERNNATTSNPFQFDSRVNSWGKQDRCRVWPGAIDCVIEMVKQMGTTNEVLVPRYYNCGKGCKLPMEYFYTHNDPDNGKIFHIKGTLENGQRVDRPDPRPGAVIISNALKNNCN